jgi:hypothetical protein
MSGRLAQDALRAALEVERLFAWLQNYRRILVRL